MSTPAPRAVTAPSPGAGAAVDVGGGVVESAHVVELAGTPSVAIVSRPADAAATASTLVLIVVGGPQYRVGSHRQFVSLARALAAAGYSALRFDVRGMGDAAGAQRAFTDLDDDVGAAVDTAFALCPSIERVVAWGLCDGASAALMHIQSTRDPRVAGLVVANPWVRSAHTLARTHVRHYYLQRLREPAFWRKMLRGKVAWTALRGLFENLSVAHGIPASDAPSSSRVSAAAPFQQRMADAWADASRPLLVVLSGRDLTAKEFLETVATDPHWNRAMRRSGITRFALPDADHTFSDPDAVDRVHRATLEFLGSLQTRTSNQEKLQ